MVFLMVVIAVGQPYAIPQLTSEGPHHDVCQVATDVAFVGIGIVGIQWQSIITHGSPWYY